MPYKGGQDPSLQATMRFFDPKHLRTRPLQLSILPRAYQKKEKHLHFPLETKRQNSTCQALGLHRWMPSKTGTCHAAALVARPLLRGLANTKFHSHSGQSASGQDLSQLQEDRIRRWRSDSGDGLIGRFLNGDPSPRSYSEPTSNQQGSNGSYPDNCSAAARAA